MYSAEAEFLLIERADKAGYWQSVTGSLDFLEEQPYEAALRELFEETGVQAVWGGADVPLHKQAAEALQAPMVLRAWPKQVEYEIFEQWRHRYPKGVTRNTEHWFYVCLPKGYSPMLAPSEHVSFGWFSAQKAQSLCFSPNNAQAIGELAMHIASTIPPCSRNKRK
jgi:dATP pyrophosphohydrolase